MFELQGLLWALGVYKLTNKGNDCDSCWINHLQGLKRVTINFVIFMKEQRLHCFCEK